MARERDWETWWFDIWGQLLDLQQFYVCLCTSVLKSEPICRASIFTSVIGQQRMCVWIWCSSWISNIVIWHSWTISGFMTIWCQHLRQQSDLSAECPSLPVLIGQQRMCVWFFCSWISDIAIWHLWTIIGFMTIVFWHLCYWCDQFPVVNNGYIYVDEITHCYCMAILDSKKYSLTDLACYDYAWSNSAFLNWLEDCSVT